MPTRRSGPGRCLGSRSASRSQPQPLARYQPLPTQPPVIRDISLVLPGEVTAAAVEAALRRVGEALLERLDVLDEYRGAGGSSCGHARRHLALHVPRPGGVGRSRIGRLMRYSVGC